MCKKEYENSGSNFLIPLNILLDSSALQFREFWSLQWFFSYIIVFDVSVFEVIVQWAFETMFCSLIESCVSNFFLLFI